MQHRRVFVNGTFDILHAGHIMLLNFAQQLGHTVTVAIDSDQRVQQIKGTGRPVNSAWERRLLLCSLRSVDQVIEFDTDQELLQLIPQFDIMVKGSDYINHSILGQGLIPIVFFQRIHDYSTTAKIQSITDRR